ncbi:MAG: FtsX-like permease family protein, partial [Ilumatobacteraceae bacterium]
AGTLVLTDTIKKSYDDLAGNVYEDTDAVVRSATVVTDANKKESRGTLDAAVLDQVRAVPGVEAADASVVGIAMVVGKDGDLLDASKNRAIPIAMAWQADDRLNPMELVDGHAPAANEIVIDRASATKGEFAVGDTIQVLNKTGSVEYTLAGIATYAGKDDAIGAQVVAFAPETAATVLGEPGRYDSVNVVAAPGVSQSELVANIESALNGADVDVITGTAQIEETRKAAGAQMQFLNTFLLTFALVALLVGSFVIYNTFSITVAQRTRETALLRAIGAKRKQVMRSLVFESVLTGLFASAIGVVAGIGTAKGIAKVFTVFDIDLPASGTVVNSSTIVISMVVGTVVTVLAAYMPARKAGKVPPIAALRDVAHDNTGTSVKRAVFGTLLTLGGAAFLAMGLSGGGIAPVGLGALGVFVGIAVLGPVIARPFARLIGSPLPRVRGMAGTIARENATRNPRRTSATASALMIGVGLVAFITVFAASTKASISQSVDNSVRSDWIVETAWGMGGLSPDAAQRIDALPETGSVTSLRYTATTIEGSSVDLTAFAPEHVNDGMDLDAVAGDLTTLGPTDIAVSEVEAEENLYALGDTIAVTFPETGAQQFTITSIFSEAGTTSGYAVSLAAFDANGVDNVDNFVLVNNADGVSTEQARTAIEHVLADYPNADVMTQDEFKGSIASSIDQMLNLVYVLLFMALAIALFGIANTLALSVFERTREIGLLRAVGMSRAQVRSSVRWESVLIALLGATLGTAIGVGFGWAMVEAMKDKGIGELTIPTTQLAYVLVLAAFAAVAAAALPARRAARMDVLGAIKTD